MTDRSDYLLQVLLDRLHAHGLVPEALHPWPAWLAFKEYLTTVAEVPDPGVSVQLTKNRPDRTTTLLFMRQVVTEVEQGLEPVGGVLVQLVFGLQPEPEPDLELWSFDYGDLARFVNVVEETPAIADRFLQVPVRSAVVWQPARNDEPVMPIRYP